MTAGGPMNAGPKICVVGSSNIDLISRVPRLPRLGETLVGHSFHLGYGGKGANQAVMAAKTPPTCGSTTNAFPAWLQSSWTTRRKT
ncbi:MAG: hypothetical protein E6H05_12410 [Bacillati bacterium ANGP1]|uniref:Carbohydrate kinase PfkB domain-containing protein n=1 Tax=Candidatus Segetimicrobium genomatis TaxID=2569760 RepID=A0A537IJP0_9BACT|nr:MAG: hypothetical protein E6H05_12410 [Terrabacteria group bacterium ANGP1]